MDFDTGITIILILLVVTVIAVGTLMTITFNWSRRKVKGTNNIDKKQAFRFAFIRRGMFTNYSEGERAQGFIYYYIGCAILLVVMIAIIVGFVLMN